MRTRSTARTRADRAVRSGLAVAVALVAAAAALAFPGLARASSAGPGTASRPGQIPVFLSICLYNRHTQCAAPKNNEVSSGTKVLLRHKATGVATIWTYVEELPNVCAGQHSCGGFYFPFSTHKFDRQFYNDPVYTYQPQNNNQVCMEGFGGQVKLEKDCTKPSTLWVRAGKQLVNVERTDFEDVVSVLHADSARNGTALDVLPSGDASGYERWAIIRCSAC